MVMRNECRATNRTIATILRQTSPWLGWMALLPVVAASSCHSSEGGTTSDCAGGSCEQGGAGGGPPGEAGSGQGMSGEAGSAQGAGSAGGPVHAPEFLTTACENGSCQIEALPDLDLATGCPVGTSCGGGSENGLGIYTSKTAQYCFSIGLQASVCPESFINTESVVAVQAPATGASGGQPGSSKVKLRYWLDDSGGDGFDLSGYSQDDATMPSVGVGASLFDLASGQMTPVILVSIKSDQGRLSVTYTKGQTTNVATTREELQQLRFRVEVATPAYTFSSVEMRIEPDGDPATSVLPRYKVFVTPYWTEIPALLDQPGQEIVLCRGSDGTGLPASFLGGKTVSGINARVTENKDAVTIGCQTGSIDTCMDMGATAKWHYAPWNPAATEPQSGDYLFATCLQAKRAAYFVGSGDPRSFTTDGTELQLRDPFGIHTDDISGTAALEAVWSPHGAVCLNPGNARHPELLPQEYTAPAGGQQKPKLPPCDSATWADYKFGKIATGKAAPKLYPSAG
jgi:ADYC domain-containing protein